MRNFLKKLGFNQRILVLTAIFAIAVLVLVGCDVVSSAVDDTNADKVKIVIADAEGLTVVSQNPMEISVGSTATIEIELEDGFGIASVSNGVVSGNTVTVSNVYAPTVVRVSTRKLEMCELNAFSVDTSMGGITSSLGENGKAYEGKEVTLTASPIGDAVFAGFSLNASLENGGTLLSSEPVYTFNLTASANVYANFFIPKNDPADSVIVPDDAWAIIYHPNGGVRDYTGSSDFHTTYFKNTYYLCPNAMPNDGTFVREGYILVGYNTEEDGSGTYYAPGWNIIMPERGAISLYCMWEEATPASEFNYSKSDDGKSIIINKYNGNREKVVIPETINGLPVTVIKTGAFSANHSIKTLILSRNLITVESRSFLRCMKLQNVYLSDTILNIGNDSFYECESFKSLYVMAVRYPYYAESRNGNFCIKFERLITVEGPKLIMASGSNSAFGLDSALFEQLLAENGYNYSIVNYGTNASANITFFLEVISHYVNKGDIIVQAPEPAHKAQWGTAVFTSHIWQMFEGAYEAISLVDIREYTNVFSTFSDFAKARNGKAGLSYEAFSKETINFYGDMVGPRIGHASSYKKNYIDKYLSQGGYGEVSYAQTAEYIRMYHKGLNRCIDMVEAAGGTCLLTFGTANYICLDKASQITGGENQTKVEEYVDKFLRATRISSISTYSMDYNLFHETNFHLTTKGAEIRTRLLVQDLLKYFNTAG